MMSDVRILICEDEPDIAEILRRSLVASGYEVSVVGSRTEAEKLIRSWTPDLVLLDIMLPESETAGWDLLGRIRQDGSAAVIMVTALSRVDDRVRALTAGADDFISKPFSLEEVKARIQAVLRRTRPSVEQLNLAIDDARKEIRVGERVIALSPKEYGLLKLLASAPGRVFSADEILSALWPGSAYATGQDVQKYVYLLRRKIEDDPKDPKIVLTVRGFGYRLAV